MNEEEIIITEENFSQYFFDVQNHKPQKGQVLACYRAVGEFVDSMLKRDVIDLLKKTDKTNATIQVLKRLGHVKEEDCYKALIEISEDLLRGMSEDDVANKSYRVIIERFFWTRKDYVPADDPHWEIINMLNLDDFLDSAGNKLASDFKLIESLVPAQGKEDEKIA